MQDTPSRKPPPAKATGARAHRLVRKQLLITQEQDQRLKMLAVASARPAAELVREALDAWLATQKAGEDDWKAGLMSVAGMWKDRTDLDALMDRSRRSWNRDHSARNERAKKPR